MSGYCLFLDFETTDLSIEKAEIVEIGFLKTTKDLKTISSGSFLVKTEHPIDERIAKDILKFDNDFILTHGQEKDYAIAKLHDMISKCKYIIAHNALGFDIPIAKKYLGSEIFKDKIIVDTLIDLPSSFYNEVASKKLKYLAVERGILLNESHRAFKDIALLHCLLTSFQDNLTEIYENASKKLYLCSVNVSFNDKDKAKEIGCRWNATEKRWEREFSEVDYKEHLDGGWPIKIILTIR